MRDQLLLAYIKALLAHWKTVVTGVLGLLVSLFAASRNDNQLFITGSALLGLVAIVIAGYMAWRDERATREAEEAKNSRPEIKGRAYGFQSRGLQGRGQDVNGILNCSAGFHFHVDLCNYRPTPTNLKEVRIMWDESLPEAVIFIVEPPKSEIILNQGMNRVVELEGGVLILGPASAKETLNMYHATVSAVDGFGKLHALDVAVGSSITLPPLMGQSVSEL